MTNNILLSLKIIEKHFFPETYCHRFGLILKDEVRYKYVKFVKHKVCTPSVTYPIKNCKNCEK